MFRQRGYRRRSRPGRSWLAGLTSVSAAGVAVLAVHLATAPGSAAASSAADVLGSGPGQHAVRASGQAGQTGHHGYGRGGYTMMPHGSQGSQSGQGSQTSQGTTEATAATTQNSAGYAATGAAGTFTSVSSSWAQPAVTCGSSQTFSSFWVGLDGTSTSTLEQTGTEADCAGGQAAYSGWFEFFPAAPVTYDKPVRPGDEMTATVTAGAGGAFVLTLRDATQQWQQSAHQTVAGARLESAEVIAEAPSSQAVLPLADFGTVNFTGATVNGQPIGSDSPVALTMASAANQTEATPSALAGGNGFSVTWVSSGAGGTTAGGGTGGSGGSGSGSGTGTGGSGTGTGGGRHHRHHGGGA